jgi:hypothetical protein
MRTRSPRVPTATADQSTPGSATVCSIGTEVGAGGENWTVGAEPSAGRASAIAGDPATARTSPAAAVLIAWRELSIAPGYSRPAPAPGPREWPPGLQNEITPMISAGSQP